MLNTHTDCLLWESCVSMDALVFNVEYCYTQIESIGLAAGNILYEFVSEYAVEFHGFEDVFDIIELIWYYCLLVYGDSV